MTNTTATHWTQALVVEGTYFGQPFHGTLANYRRHSINHECWIANVELTEAFYFDGNPNDPRTTLCLEGVTWDGDNCDSYNGDRGGMSIRPAEAPKTAQTYMLIATSENGAVQATIRAESLEAAFRILEGELTMPEEDSGITADVIAEAWKDAQEMTQYFSVRRRYVRWGMIAL